MRLIRQLYFVGADAYIGLVGSDAMDTEMVVRKTNGAMWASPPAVTVYQKRTGTRPVPEIFSC